MKAYYNPEGDPCWIDTLVEILAWDGDKWITFKNSLGEISADKLWKFSIKRSNKLYKLPRGYMDDVWYPRNRDVTEELKVLRKRKVLYTAELDSGNFKEFRHLEKALNFCKSNKECNFLKGSFWEKRSSFFTPILVKEDGWRYFYKISRPISNKTLSNWVMSN